MGDWVALELGGENRETMIRARLARQTCLSRKASGRSAEEQVIAANVSVVVVVTDAGADLNLRRVERYSAIIGKSGAKAVVLVNKSDLFCASKIRKRRRRSARSILQPTSTSGAHRKARA